MIDALKSIEPIGFLSFAPASAGTNRADVYRRIIQNRPYGRGGSTSAACRPVWFRLRRLRIRLFFWADRALADWQLKAWLSGYPVDQSIFAPAQPVYVARPIFIGMPDPVPTRSGIWRGDRDAITPPTITKPRGYCSQRAIRPAKLEHLLWRRLRGLPRADRRP